MKARFALACGLISVGAAALPDPEHSSAETAPTPAQEIPVALPAGTSAVGELLADQDRHERSARERLAEIKKQGAALDALTVAHGRAYVRLARAGLLPVGGGFDAFMDHAAEVERLRRTIGRDLDKRRRLAEERARREAELATMKPRRAALEAERVALARSHTAIAAAEERELAFRRAFSSDWKPSAHTAVYAGSGPLSIDDVRSGFARLRGRLPFPLTGRAEIRRARRLSGGAVATVGLELLSMPGAVVRSVFPGRVAFADAYADYGAAVIVDHGAGYYTVSAGFETLEVEVGDEVAGGDRLGTVATTAEGTVLYFEVRKGSEALDPSPWFGI